jgi:hypothetical protein
LRANTMVAESGANKINDQAAIAVAARKRNQ